MGRQQGLGRGSGRGCDDGGAPLFDGHAALQGTKSQFRDRLQRLEDAGPVPRRGLVPLDGAVEVEGVVQLVDREDVREIAFVVLEDAGRGVEGDPDLGEVLAEVAEALDVRVLHGPLGIGDEDDAVHALEDELPRRVVEHLPRNGVQLEAGLEAPDDTHVERKQVEKERAICLGLEAHHLPARCGCRPPVDHMEIRRFSTEARTVVHDLCGHLHRRVIEKNHKKKVLPTS